MRERESERGRKRKGVRVRERKKGREGIEGEGGTRTFIMTKGLQY